jgi:hypothetical protein
LLLGETGRLSPTRSLSDLSLRCMPNRVRPQFLTASELIGAYKAPEVGSDGL